MAASSEVETRRRRNRVGRIVFAAMRAVLQRREAPLPSVGQQ
jgi:hypothetical protein